MVSGLAWRGFAGRAPTVRDQRLRYLASSRIDVGPFEEFEVLRQKPVRTARIAEVDRDGRRGWLWLTQRRLLPESTALTIVARVRRPGAETAEKLRLVLVCEGGQSGAHG